PGCLAQRRTRASSLGQTAKAPWREYLAARRADRGQESRDPSHVGEAGAQSDAAEARRHRPGKARPSAQGQGAQAQPARIGVPAAVGTAQTRPAGGTPLTPAASFA